MLIQTQVNYSLICQDERTKKAYLPRINELKAYCQDHSRHTLASLKVDHVHQWKYSENILVFSWINRLALSCRFGIRGSLSAISMRLTSSRRRSLAAANVLTSEKSIMALFMTFNASLPNLFTIKNTTVYIELTPCMPLLFTYLNVQRNPKWEIQDGCL